MSIETYVLTKQAPAALTPASIGLGTETFPWPDADSPHGFRYDHSRLELEIAGIADIVEAFSTFDGIAPADAQGCIKVHLGWYIDGFEHVVASAFGGIATTDAELSEGPYRPSREALDDGMEPPDAPTWREPVERARRELRAALYADRFRAADATDLDARARAAVQGNADQLALLEMWIARGTARVHGEPSSPRSSDATAARDALERART